MVKSLHPLKFRGLILRDESRRTRVKLKNPSHELLKSFLAGVKPTAKRRSLVDFFRTVPDFPEQEIAKMFPQFEEFVLETKKKYNSVMAEIQRDREEVAKLDKKQFAIIAKTKWTSALLFRLKNDISLRDFVQQADPKYLDSLYHQFEK